MIVLRFKLKYNYREISDVYGISVDACKKRSIQTDSSVSKIICKKISRGLFIPSIFAPQCKYIKNRHIVFYKGFENKLIRNFF